MSYAADGDRYDEMRYTAAAAAALAARDLTRALAEPRRHHPARDEPGHRRRAFDLGVTHFDLANNYGPPYGSRPRTSAGSCGTTFGPTATSS